VSVRKKLCQIIKQYFNINLKILSNKYKVCEIFYSVKT